MTRASLALLLWLGCTAAAGPVEPPGPELRRVDGRVLMGTVLEMDVRGLAPAGADALLEELFAEVAAEEQLFSRFDPGAALVALNAAAGSGWTPVDPRLAALLEQARQLSAQTRGTFDVTVGPLVELWTRAGQSGALPDAGALAAARSRVGSERIQVQTSPPRVALAAGTSIDLGGVAKGFALDQLTPRLLRSGVRAALLSFGQSSLQAIGAPPGESGWRILLPDAGDGFAGTVTLRDCALSVSSSLGQSTQIAGRSYGHVIDPRSGEPLSSGRLAAVVSPSGTTAEALSKALLLLDETQAAAVLAAFPQSAGMRIEADGRRWSSEGWAALSRFSNP